MYTVENDACSHNSEFFAKTHWRSFIFKRVVLECTKIMHFAETPELALYALSYSMLWYMFHIPENLVVICATVIVSIMGYGMSVVKPCNLQCEFMWQLLYHRKVGPTVHVKQAYHICRCCFSKWLWSPCAICM